MLQGEDHGSQFIISVSSNMDRTLQSITIMVDTVPPEDGIWNQQDNSSRVDFIVGNGSGSSSDTPFEFVGIPESVHVPKKHWISYRKSFFRKKVKYHCISLIWHMKRHLSPQNMYFHDQLCRLFSGKCLFYLKDICF